MNLSELFVSTQGEGSWAGQVTTFVRFGGCNVCCSWCDEANSIPIRRPKSESITPYDLCELIEKQKTKHVCLTGGEPLIQDAEELGSLCESLKAAGKAISVETNGTRIVPELFDYLDMWTVSPKLSSAENVTPVSLLVKNVNLIQERAKNMQLKFVIGSREDSYDIKKYLDAFPNILFYVQSVWLEDGEIFEPKYTISDLQKLFTDSDIDYKNRNLRFGVQLHKFFNVK